MFRRRTPADPAAELAGRPYGGDPRAVIFREGFHYPVRFDSDGNELGPDAGLPLVWRDGGLHHALPDEPNHFHRYGLNAVELVPHGDD